ncbi:MAG: hypothetical protein GY717_18255 [Rhodobacteraceae bacterium]|nr:hypothetical protein [Paracoccaceae bacterium]
MLMLKRCKPQRCNWPGRSGSDRCCREHQAEGRRGYVGGPTHTPSRLRAGCQDNFKDGFHGSNLAEIAIVGGCDADLDLLVTDEKATRFASTAGNQTGSIALSPQPGPAVSTSMSTMLAVSGTAISF